MAAPDRYLITFAYIPDEASWCVCTNFAAVARKVKDLWDVDDCALVFYLTSPAGKATAVKMTTEEDFELWYRGGSPVTQKLIVHDRQRALKVTHSSGFVQMSHRPMLDSLTLRDLGASFYVRHSGLDEVFLVSENEPTVWGRAVQKAQRAWNVHRPLFRYVDDNHGERVVVTIIDAKDFSMWSSHRRPLLPELTVFEHAAPQLLNDPLAYALSPPEGMGVKPRSADATSALADIARAPYLNPPELKNTESVDTLTEKATGRPRASSKAAATLTVGEEAFRSLQRHLERRAEVDALARQPVATPASREL
jgi:hypothetical protein